MPTKYETFAELAARTERMLTDSTENWKAFLTTAARLYKYPYHEQFMIYAQRPDATACADYETWNKRMGRYVKRGSTGIALLDDSGIYPKIRYVFDVSDTGTRVNSRDVKLWTMEERRLKQSNHTRATNRHTNPDHPKVVKKWYCNLLNRQMSETK